MKILPDIKKIEFGEKLAEAFNLTKVGDASLFHVQRYSTARGIKSAVGVYEIANSILKGE